jgi:adenylate cyclase
VSERQTLCTSVPLSGTIRIGRQKGGEAASPAHSKTGDGQWRVVIAGPDASFISRDHAVLEPLGADKVRLTNLSDTWPIGLQGLPPLPPGGTCELLLPATLYFSELVSNSMANRRTVLVRHPRPTDEDIQGLKEASQAPGRIPSEQWAALARPTNKDLTPEVLLKDLRHVVTIFQGLATKRDFQEQAAAALVHLVNLDVGRFLEWKGGRLEPSAQHFAGDVGARPEWRPSDMVLQRVCEKKGTYWLTPGRNSAENTSLVGMEAVVAAPILDEAGEIVAVLYGDRRAGGQTGLPAVTRYEAMLVEVLAAGVASGLARLRHEEAAREAREKFEQFFTPELSRHLAEDPTLLEGKKTQVSVLFCDIRGFSRVSQRLGPERTFRWIGEVMEALSQCVRDQEGVLVDYIGDELMAMWGAPKPQPDHAARACRAALAMIDRAPALNQTWQAIMEEPLQVGIGINSGTALVGNTGSRFKYKYGPLGHTVNLASRVQGATKYLKSKILITDATHRQLAPGFATRRVCNVRVINIADTVKLYELVRADQPGWHEFQEAYEAALEAYERQDFAQAAGIVGDLILREREKAPAHRDYPSLRLLAQAAFYLAERPDKFDPVWELPGK